MSSQPEPPEVSSLRQAKYQLYVAGRSERSALAEQNLRAVTQRLHGPVQIEVIDLTRRPDLAEELDIVATPMVLRVLPEPPRRVVGDLSDQALLAQALDLGDRADD